MTKYLMILLTISILIVGCDQLSESTKSQDVFEIQPSMSPPSTRTIAPSQPTNVESEKNTDAPSQDNFKNPGCSNLPEDVICTCINGSWHNCYSLNDTDKKKSVSPLLNKSGALLDSAVSPENPSESTIINVSTSPKLMLNPSIGTANSLIKATGTGFPPNSSVLITYHYGNASNNRATFTTDQQGAFSNMFPVPSDVISGSQNLVRATTTKISSSGTSEQISSSTNHFIPSDELSISPTTITPGSKLTITGKNFSAYNSIKYLQIGNVNILPNTKPTTDSSGTFSTEITVPNISSGLHLLVAIIGNKTASTYLNVSFVSSYNPILVVDPELSYSGSAVNVKGRNYPPNTNVLITYVFGLSSLNIGNISTDGAGQFNTSISVPSDATTQTNNLIQSTATADLGNNIFETITAGARHYVPVSLLKMSQSKLMPGEIMTLSGSGFPINGSITSITIGNASIITMTSNSIDAQGKFNTEFVIPRLSIGVHLLTLTSGTTTTSQFLEIIN